MAYVTKFVDFLNESNYNLGLGSREYGDKIKAKLKNIDGIGDSDYSYVQDTSSSVMIKIEGKRKNVKEDVKKALAGFDENLDLNSIEDNFDATDYERSKHDQDNDLWSVTIEKKKNYHEFPDADPRKKVTKMDHNVVMGLLDILAQFSSEGTDLADLQWRSLDDFMSAAADTMSKKNFETYKKRVKETYPNLK